MSGRCLAIYYEGADGQRTRVGTGKVMPDGTLRAWLDVVPPEGVAVKVSREKCACPVRHRAKKEQEDGKAEA